MYCLCAIGFGGDECIVCVLQGLVVRSADLRRLMSECSADLRRR